MRAFGTWAQAIAALAWVACTAIGKADTTSGPVNAEPAEQYRLAPGRADVLFDVEYFRHARISMRFSRIRARLAGIEHSLGAARVSVTIDAASLETSVPFVTRIVEGDDMLAATRYPAIRFVSTHFIRTSASSGLLTGELTIRATTREVTLSVTFDEMPRAAPGGMHTLAFAADGHFSRAAFGLSRWPTAVGDDVHMKIEAEFVRERANP